MKKPSPRIWLEPVETSAGALASFQVRVAGLPIGKKLSLEFFEVDPPGKSRDDKRSQKTGDVLIGSVSGTVARAALTTNMAAVPSFTLAPSASANAAPAGANDVVEFVFAGSNDSFKFAIPNEALDLDEGDFWEIQVRAKTPKIVSPILTIAHVRRSVEGFPYTWHEGHNLTLYHDGATDPDGNQGAFADLMAAIDQAQRFIFVVDWSFHPFFKPNVTSTKGLADTIGGVLLAKAKAGVTVAIHTWDHTDLFDAAPDAQNDDGDDWLDALGGHLTIKRKSVKLKWRASSPSAVAYSHHQKFVLMDQPPSNGRQSFRVFFGGLDLTQGRLDWGEHPVAATDKRLASRRVSWGPDRNHLANEWYNAETGGALALPRQPWHDIHGTAEGPVTWDFLREFVVRWASHGSTEMGDSLAKRADPVCDVWKAVLDRTKWVQADEPYEGPWVSQLLRSNTRDRCEVAAQFSAGEASLLTQALPAAREASILAMYQQAIDHADRFIYIENQYLIGSGARWADPRTTVANDLPERIVNKILAKRGQPFHVYVVTPMFPEGNPVGTGGIEIRNYEWRTIRYMVETLNATLGASWSDYLTLMFLADWREVARTDWSSGDRNARLRAHQRYMVYVHSKMMIVDDRFIIFGSANLNERSLSGGRDTEIAGAFWPGRNQEQTCIDALRQFRKDLFTEHFGAEPDGADDPASSQCIAAIQKIADANYLSLRTLGAGRQGHACRVPAGIVRGALAVVDPATKVSAATPEGGFRFLPDGVPTDDLWRWDCRGSRLALGETAE